MWIKKIAEWRAAGVPCAMATIIDSAGSTPRKTGAKMAVNSSGEIAGSVGGGTVELHCIALAKESITRQTCITRRFVSRGEGEEWTLEEQDNSLGLCGGTITVFIEPLILEPELVIFGGGHIGVYLGKLCDILEMPYRVYDERKEFADVSRFPGARERVCGPFTDIASNIKLSDKSYCVIMTYGHDHDEEVLEQLLKMSDIPYIGMVGSSKKAGALIENIRKRGGTINNRLYCPVGLRIGRNLPQEIAFSAMAEIMLLARGGSPEHMSIDWSRENIV